MSGPRVLAIGVFDLLHVGHLRFLQFARARGSHLTVLAAPDALALSSKRRLPWIDQQQRMEMLRGLACVDRVALLPATLEDPAGVAGWIVDLDVQLVVVGDEWRGSARWQRLTPVLAELGIAVEYAPPNPGVSTSAIAARILGAG